ncbi:hypothetical protein ST37_03895 [Vibrio sp. qd031]|uniref:hypothetical protein n=1 Tax=Vibrio sp. qd031 TaxID=1603038 RepID=UPI000A107127|nr:hypothetical protein [Vibrio sp. qd031]ORT52152.1 hypothetical protein ST37_03895 [Vibrio sp. qd031]
MKVSTVNELLLCSVIGTVAMLGYGVMWEWVVVDSLILAVISAIIMAIVLKSSVAFERWAAKLCLSQNKFPKVKRFFSSWFILIGSKVVAMGAIVVLFGEQVQFLGPAGGVVAFYLTIVSIVIAESLFIKSLSARQASATAQA